jgi:hypothetical protein
VVVPAPPEHDSVDSSIYLSRASMLSTDSSGYGAGVVVASRSLDVASFDGEPQHLWHCWFHVGLPSDLLESFNVFGAAVVAIECCVTALHRVPAPYCHGCAGIPMGSLLCLLCCFGLHNLAGKAGVTTRISRLNRPVL